MGRKASLRFKSLCAAFFVAVSMTGAGWAGAGPRGQARCVSPDLAVAIIRGNHPGAVMHVMKDGEFAAFAEDVGLRYGDAAIWFERPGVAVVYVVVFVGRCRVGGGEIARGRLMALLQGPVA